MNYVAYTEYILKEFRHLLLQIPNSNVKFSNNYTNYYGGLTLHVIDIQQSA